MKKYISEFVGTMMLVLLACGVAVVVGCSTPAGITTGFFPIFDISLSYQ